MLAIWSLVPLPFAKTSLNIWKFTVHILLKPGLENFKHYFTSLWDECNCAVVWALFGIAFLWDWNENWPFPILWPLLSFPNLLAYWVQHFHSHQLCHSLIVLKPAVLNPWAKTGPGPWPFRRWHRRWAVREKSIICIYSLSLLLTPELPPCRLRAVLDSHQRFNSTVLESSWSLPTYQVHGKIVFHKTSPWCQKSWGPLSYTLPFI